MPLPQPSWTNRAPNTATPTRRPNSPQPRMYPSGPPVGSKSMNGASYASSSGCAQPLPSPPLQRPSSPHSASVRGPPPMSPRAQAGHEPRPLVGVRIATPPSSRPNSRPASPMRGSVSSRNTNAPTSRPPPTPPASRSATPTLPTHRPSSRGPSVAAASQPPSASARFAPAIQTPTRRVGVDDYSASSPAIRVPPSTSGTMARGGGVVQRGGGGQRGGGAGPSSVVEHEADAFGAVSPSLLAEAAYEAAYPPHTASAPVAQPLPQPSSTSFATAVGSTAAASLRGGTATPSLPLPPAVAEQCPFTAREHKVQALFEMFGGVNFAEVERLRAMGSPVPSAMAALARQEVAEDVAAFLAAECTNSGVGTVAFDDVWVQLRPGQIQSVFLGFGGQQQQSAAGGGGGESGGGGAISLLDAEWPLRIYVAVRCRHDDAAHVALALQSYADEPHALAKTAKAYQSAVQRLVRAEVALVEMEEPFTALSGARGGGAAAAGTRSRSVHTTVPSPASAAEVDVRRSPHRSRSPVRSHGANPHVEQQVVVGRHHQHHSHSSGGGSAFQSVSDAPTVSASVDHNNANPSVTAASGLPTAQRVANGPDGSRVYLLASPTGGFNSSVVSVNRVGDEIDSPSLRHPISIAAAGASAGSNRSNPAANNNGGAAAQPYKRTSSTTASSLRFGVGGHGDPSAPSSPSAYQRHPSGGGGGSSAPYYLKVSEVPSPRGAWR